MNVPEQFDLINGLIEVVLVILDNLHAHHLFGVNVIALNRLRESGTSKIFNHLISARHNAIYHDWEIFCLLKTCLFTVENDSQIVTIVDYVVELSRIKGVI